MRIRHLGSILLAALAMIVLTACGGSAPKPDPSAEIPTLAQVRQLAETAMNTALPSDQRQQARTEAMTRLLALLRQAESTGIKKADWEQPVGEAKSPLIRYYESSRVRVYTLTIPFSGIVPPGERVAVQYVPPSGPPVAVEAEVQPGGQLVGTLALDENRSLTLAFSLTRGGGYLLHLGRDAKTGEFRPEPAPLRGLPTAVGDTRFELKGSFLMVDLPVDAQWNPKFDPKTQRIYFNADLGLEWKGKFSLLDERSFTAFEGFLAAANPATAKEERMGAWEKATRKLPAYLSQMDSLQDSLTGKLPSGARVFEDHGANMMVRLISIPAPDFAGKPSFTVIQHRSGNGLPMAQVIDLPGVMESVRAVQRHGLPGLMILSADKARTVTLLKATTANDWGPAPDWFGFLPTDEAIKLQRTGGSLTISAADPKANLTVSLGGEGHVEICQAPGKCFTLNWIGGRLTGAGWVGARVQQALQPGAGLTQVMAAAELIKQYLTSGDAAGASVAELVPALSGGTGLRGVDLREGGKAFVFPPNSSGVMPILLQSGQNVLIHAGGAPGTVEQWADLREVAGGNDRYVVVLGRSADKAAVLLYKHGARGWEPANALAQPADKMLGEWTILRYTPGQAEPVAGLYITGKTDLRAGFATAGNGVFLCEASKPCTTYVFEQGWVLK